MTLYAYILIVSNAHDCGMSFFFLQNFGGSSCNDSNTTKQKKSTAIIPYRKNNLFQFCTKKKNKQLKWSSVVLRENTEPGMNIEIEKEKHRHVVHALCTRNFAHPKSLLNTENKNTTSNTTSHNNTTQKGRVNVVVTRKCFCFYFLAHLYTGIFASCKKLIPVVNFTDMNYEGPLHKNNSII